MKQIHKKCIIVLICLLILGNFAHGAVLCIGSNGHISIELTPADCCDESPDIPVGVLQNSFIDADCPATTDSCGDCIDIPIPGNCGAKRLTPFATKDSSHIRFLSKNIISVYINNTVSTDKERFAILANHVSDTLTSIGTVVLIV